MDEKISYLGFRGDIVNLTLGFDTSEGQCDWQEFLAKERTLKTQQKGNREGKTYSGNSGDRDRKETINLRQKVKQRKFVSLVKDLKIFYRKKENAWVETIPMPQSDIWVKSAGFISI